MLARMPSTAMLRNITQTGKHTAIACAAYLADKRGTMPDGIRADAVRKLWVALNDCCIMQTGEYVLDVVPAPGSAGAQAIAESRSRPGIATLKCFQPGRLTVCDYLLVAKIVVDVYSLYIF